jgi:MFS family permease
MTAPPPAPRSRFMHGDTNLALLVPLLTHVVLMQMTVVMIRVTTSYRAIELELPVVWLGIISAGFALLPIVAAVPLGRYIDRGNDSRAVWMGAVLILIGCFGLWALPDSAIHLLLFSVILGLGHTCTIAAQQTMIVRCASPKNREAVFGNYVVAVSVGLSLGPFMIGWLGGAALVPPTGPLFRYGLIGAAVCSVLSLSLRPARREAGRAQGGEVIPLAKLLRLRGLAAMMSASVSTVTALDLLVIYLPLLGTERGIDARHIGALLTARSLSALAVRIFFVRILRFVGRRPLTLTTMLISGATFALLAAPFPLSVLYGVIIVLGAAIGIASTLTLSGIMEVAPPGAHATALTMRLTGNRIGQAVIPLLASGVAAATGAAGILLLVALSLSVSGTAVSISQREPKDL